MKLYVCWGSFGTGPHTHPCQAASKALDEAGHEHEVVRTYSFGALPDVIQTPGRRTVKAGTGTNWVPALELDDGTWIGGSKRIIAWAAANPAPTG
jgi:hypothetical protein